MSEWIPPLDDAIGGVQDVVGGTLNFVLGGIGSTIQDLLGGAAETGGTVLEEIFGGPASWLIQMSLIFVGGVLLWRMLG